jgi:hypothetical protein
MNCITTPTAINLAWEPKRARQISARFPHSDFNSCLRNMKWKQSFTAGHLGHSSMSKQRLHPVGFLFARLPDMKVHLNFFNQTKGSSGRLGNFFIQMSFFKQTRVN